MVTSIPSEKLAEARNLNEVEHFSLRLIGCKHCHNTDIVKYGTYKGRQRYFCNACNRKFADTNALPGKRFPAEQVGAAVSMFYRGLSTQEIGQQLAQQYDIPPPSKSTVYRWVTEYTRYALKEAGPQKAVTGNTWVADETVLKVGGRNYWLWDVMDARSRFLLASRLSPTRYTNDAETVFRQAARRASGPPKIIVTDRLRSYIDGIERVFGSESKHIQSGGIRAEINNNLSERLQGTVKQRTKVMRGLQNRETAQLMIDGWAFHYNHFKPHESLKGKTPAEVAKVTSPFANWEDIARREPVIDQPLRERRLRDSTLGREKTAKGKVVPASAGWDAMNPHRPPWLFTVGLCVSLLLCYLLVSQWLSYRYGCSDQPQQTPLESAYVYQNGSNTNSGLTLLLDQLRIRNSQGK